MQTGFAYGIPLAVRSLHADFRSSHLPPRGPRNGPTDHDPVAAGLRTHYPRVPRPIHLRRSLHSSSPLQRRLKRDQIRLSPPIALLKPLQFGWTAPQSIALRRAQPLRHKEPQRRTSPPKVFEPWPRKHTVVQRSGFSTAGPAACLDDTCVLTAMITLPPLARSERSCLNEMRAHTQHQHHSITEFLVGPH